MLGNKPGNTFGEVLGRFVSVGLMMVLSGCGKWFSRTTTTQPARPARRRIILPAGIAQTVSAYATLVGGSPLPVMGYGIVGGLGDTGSSEVPSHLRKVLIQQMSKRLIQRLLIRRVLFGLPCQLMLAN